MTYQEYRASAQKQFDELPIFWAFSNEQFKKALEERGVSMDERGAVCRLPFNGGFYLKRDAEIIKAYVNREDPLKKLMGSEQFAEEAFYYELCNHEYAINYQGDYDVCSCFGNCEYEEYKAFSHYLKEMGYSDKVVGAYRKAKQRYFKDAEENEWF